MKRIVTTALALAMSLPLFATNWTVNGNTMTDGD